MANLGEWPPRGQVIVDDVCVRLFWLKSQRTTKVLICNGINITDDHGSVSWLSNQAR